MSEVVRARGGVDALRAHQQSAARREAGLGRWLRTDQAFALALVAPMIVAVTLVSLYPSLYALYISLTNYNPAGGAIRFIGLQNYLALANAEPFQHALAHTIRFTAIAVALGTTLGLAMALLLNETFVGRGLLRSVVILPWALPGVAIGIIWAWGLDANYGFLNGLLYGLGLTNSYIPWLQTGWVALDIIAVILVWNQAPMATILFLAGLQAIPPNLYRAAKVDGAGVFQRFFRITLPWLRSTLVLVLILLTLNAMAMFDLIFVMTKGGPGDDTTVMSWLGYLTIFNFFQFGRGAATLLILSIISLGLGTLYLNVVRRGGGSVTLDTSAESVAMAPFSAHFLSRKGPFRPPLRHRVVGPRLSKIGGRGVLYLAAIAIALWSFLPIYWMTTGSLLHYADLLTKPPKLLPLPPTTDNYTGIVGMIFGSFSFGGASLNEVHVTDKVPIALRNSFIVAIGTSIVSVVLGSLAGYAYARYGRFKVLGISLGAMALVKLVPALAIIVPWFIMFKALHLTDSKLGLIICYSSFTIPIVLFVMQGYFEGIPVNLERAAWVDGCTRLQALRRVIVPVAIPGVIAGAIFTFLLSWNEFFFALNLTTTPNAQTIPVILGQLASEILFQPSAQTLLMAACTSTVIIPVLVAFLFQRYLIQGLISGSGKG